VLESFFLTKISTKIVCISRIRHGYNLPFTPHYRGRHFANRC